MQTRSSDSYTYMGLLDDSVQRFPWRFRVDEETLSYLLIVELLNGKPVLLNDGYLVNNELIRASIVKRDGLLWELIRAGFVRVMSRGGEEYGLDELPLRMAKHIPTFAEAVRDELPGLPWKDLKAALERADKQLRDTNNLVPWPSFDVGSGFLALVENLRSRGVSAHALGIGKYVSKGTLTSLLDEVSDHLSRDTRAARTTWERCVLKYANNPSHTSAPTQFVSALMNLANEMYHYNMGILLTAEFGASVSVQTQTSPAFDDLLVLPSMKFLLEELPTLPRLHVPLAITQVNPVLLASIVIPGSPIFDARARWLRLRNDWEAGTASRAGIAGELKDAGEEYAKVLSQFVGSQIKFKETEELVEYVVGDLAKLGIGAVAGSALAVAGAPASLIAAGTAGGMVLGYAVTRARKRVLGSVFKKFRIQTVQKSLTISPKLAPISERAMRVIRRRQVPSTIQIPPSVVTVLAPRLRRFMREA